MDRVKGLFSALRISTKGIVGFILLLSIAVLGYKAVDREWFQIRSKDGGLQLNDRPALLFFNSYIGCECYRAVYRAAEVQISTWSEEDRMGVPVITIDLDRRSELRKQYEVVRAPTLILVDSAGKIVHRQSDVVSDANPLDLETFEKIIQEMLHGK